MKKFSQEHQQSIQNVQANVQSKILESTPIIKDNSSENNSGKQNDNNKNDNNKNDDNKNDNNKNNDNKNDDNIVVEIKDQ